MIDLRRQIEADTDFVAAYIAKGMSEMPLPYPTHAPEFCGREVHAPAHSDSHRYGDDTPHCGDDLLIETPFGRYYIHSDWDQADDLGMCDPGCWRVDIHPTSGPGFDLVFRPYRRTLPPTFEAILVALAMPPKPCPPTKVRCLLCGRLFVPRVSNLCWATDYCSYRCAKVAGVSPKIGRPKIVR